MKIELLFLRDMKYIIIFFLLLNWPQAQAQELGKIYFEPSGSAVALPYFEKGLLLLHHFRYEEAAREFQMAQLLDPELIMAYWGEAKCYDKAFWYQQDSEKARGVLYKLGVRKEKRLERAKTDMERDFLNTVELLFAEGGTLEERQVNYNHALKEMYEKNPGEAEVATFFALSTLTNHPWLQDQSALESALDILEMVLEKNPNHPGALNYLLHGCASPDRAYKARKAVLQYPETAPEMPYCHHLPAHVLSVTGKWDDYVRANQMAWDLSEKEAKAKKRTLEERDYHSLWWLTYGLLQQGKFNQAAEYVKDMNQDAKYSKSAKMRYYLAMMKSAYLFETGQWESPISDLNVPSMGFTINTKNLVYALEGMRAVSKDDLSRAGWYVMQMQDQRTVEKGKPSSGMEYVYCDGYHLNLQVFPTLPMQRAEIMELQLKAMISLGENNEADALDLLEQALSIEKSLPAYPGPPITGKPSAELYGDLLLQLNKPDEALLMFDEALRSFPNRTLSLIGKYRAHTMLGDSEQAIAFKKMIMVNWEGAEPQAMQQLD